ncbi:MAG: archaetidylserine decarboxylase [Myxococcota bacterium]
MFEAITGRALILFLGLLPKNLLSRLAGALASVRLPRPLRRWKIIAFGRIFGVNFGEVRDPLDSFGSVQEFFTRALKPGVRPVDESADALVSPCDGAWGQCGLVEQGQLLQIKGRPYSVGALLGDEEAARRFEGGCYATLYLSPRDYHRFHAPTAGEVVRADYLPGSLWPVNRAGVRFVEGLFAENERIVAWLRPDCAPSEMLCMVAVGATMVGKVKVTFDSLETNLPPRAKTRRDYSEDACPRLARGEEWGRFEFGSTIVMVATPGWLELHREQAGVPVTLGARIGSVR